MDAKSELEIDFQRKGPSLGTNSKAVVYLTRLTDMKEKTPQTETTGAYHTGRVGKLP